MGKLQQIEVANSAMIERQLDYDQLPSKVYRAAIQNPWIRTFVIAVSLNEYKDNPYYKSLISKWSKSIVGPFPSVIALSDDDDLNDRIEDAYTNWGSSDRVGFAYREMTRMAALTGIGIAVKTYKKEVPENEVGLTYKVFGAHHLKVDSKHSSVTKDERLINGIQYDEGWNIAGMWINEKYYKESELLYWYIEDEDGIVCLYPPCGQAFSIYPSIKRIIEAVVKGEEFRSSLPMAVETDATIYANSIKNKEAPTGMFPYEPGMIPTLPPGLTLKGVPGSATRGADQEKIIRLVASACALCIDMPANIALGDSSNSNMASAQIDIQPWNNKLKIDRFDLLPAFHRSFYHWYEMALKMRGILDSEQKKKYPKTFPFTLAFQNLFHHPDPNKNSNSKFVDLKSGFGTLNRFYSENGMNPKRELQREAKLYGLTYEEFVQALLIGRNNFVQPGLYEDEEEQKKKEPVEE